MNHLTSAGMICAAMFFAACQEAKDEVAQPLAAKDIYRTIGEEIPFETGMQWIDHFQAKAGAAGRFESSPECIVPAEEMKTLLSSVDDLVGVAFHYSIDDFGAAHILVIPVTGSMQLWSPASQRVIVDANTGTPISEETASKWAENFKQQYPSEIWYHFFGKDVFDQMRALPYFESVDIERATNPADDSPQLLLIVWNNQQTSSGRTSAESGTVYDASNACPPCATQ